MRRCELCGRGPVAGRTYTYRGQLKKKGGVGRKTVRKNRRRFLPNLPLVRAVLNGTTRRLLVCMPCLKGGRVVKPR